MGSCPPVEFPVASFLECPPLFVAGLFFVPTRGGVVLAFKTGFLEGREPKAPPLHPSGMAHVTEGCESCRSRLWDQGVYPHFCDTRESAMTGGQGGSQQPKRSFALRSNVHAPTGAVATVARCRADKGAPLSRAMVAAVDQQLTCHNRRNRMGQKPFSTADPVADAPSRP